MATRHVNNTPHAVHPSGTAQDRAGLTSSQIKLDPSISLEESDLVGWGILIGSGASAGNDRYITGYNSGTKVATVNAAFTSTGPTAGDTYTICQGSNSSSGANISCTTGAPGTGPKRTLSGSTGAIAACTGAADLIRVWPGTTYNETFLDLTYAYCTAYDIASYTPGTPVVIAVSGTAQGITIAGNTTDVTLTDIQISGAFTSGGGTAAVYLNKDANLTATRCSFVNTGGAYGILCGNQVSPARVVTLVDTDITGLTCIKGSSGTDGGINTLLVSGGTWTGRTGFTAGGGIVKKAIIDGVTMALADVANNYVWYSANAAADVLDDYIGVLRISNCTGTAWGLIWAPAHVGVLDIQKNTLTLTANGSNSIFFGYEVTNYPAYTAKAYTAGNIVMPTSKNGRRYKATNSATSPGEPTWPTTVGATVDDGAVTWECLAGELSTPYPIGLLVLRGNSFTWTSASSDHLVFVGVGILNTVISDNVFTATASTGGYGLVLKADRCNVANNVLNVKSSIAVFVSGAYSLIRSNTVYHTGAGTAVYVAHHQEADYSYLRGVPLDCLIDQNIVYCTAGTPVGVESYTDSEDWNVMCDRNVYYTGGTYIASIGGTAVNKSGGIAAVQSRWVAWLTGLEGMVGNDAESMVTDPMLVGPADGNFNVKTNSPARTLGSSGGPIGGVTPSLAGGSKRRSTLSF